MEDDRRATLEAAVAASEEGLNISEAVEKITAESEIKTATEDVKGAHVATTEGGPDEPTPKISDATGAPQSADSVTIPEKPPQAWKPAQKAKWAALDQDIRQEVLRREHETTKVLNETASARQLAQQFQAAVQPYMARLKSQNAHPIKAVENLLAADHLLSTAPKVQKAQFLAKLINDYGVDIMELDNALSGKPAVDPVESRVEQLLQQRLAPFQQYMTAQQQQAQQRAVLEEQRVAQTVEGMSNNPEFPYFDDVRDTMADIVEIMAKKGVPIDLTSAYNKAVAMDPAISQVVANTTAATQAAANAAKANAKAQRALQASSSVGGAPSGSIGGKLDASDRRAAIAAAFELVGGR